MAAITDLVPDVRVEIPDIPSFVAERQLLRAMREFCEESRSWRVNISISVAAATPTVLLTSLLPTSTELVDIISIKNVDGGGPVVPRTYIWLDQNTTDWRSETDDTAKWYLLDGNNTVRFVPTPSATAANQYYARVAVKPLLTATTVNDVVVNKYDELIVHGALSRLYSIPRKPWTDDGRAAYHMSLFREGIPRARQEASDEFQTGVPRKVKYGGI